MGDSHEGGIVFLSTTRLYQAFSSGYRGYPKSKVHPSL